MSLMHKRTLIILIIISVIILLVVYISRSKEINQFPAPPTKTVPSPTLWFKKPPNPDNVRCPMDVTQCPDGSYVGRIAPSCSFAPCPKISNSN